MIRYYHPKPKGKKGGRKKFDPQRFIRDTRYKILTHTKVTPEGIRFIQPEKIPMPKLSQKQWMTVGTELAVALISRLGIPKEKIFKQLKERFGKAKRKEFEKIKQAIEKRLARER